MRRQLARMDSSNSESSVEEERNRVSDNTDVSISKSMENLSLKAPPRLSVSSGSTTYLDALESPAFSEGTALNTPPELKNSNGTKTPAALIYTPMESNGLKTSNGTKKAGALIFTPVESYKGKPKFDEKFDDCAWTFDEKTNEFYFSSDKNAIDGAEWPHFRIPTELYERLYSHQKVGVQWMASLHSKRIGGAIGGILGDDMV
jgi:SNF2 family DNA or RNA helicase